MENEEPSYLTYLKSELKLYAKSLSQRSCDPYEREYDRRLRLACQVASRISLKFTSKKLLSQIEDPFILSRVGDFVTLYKSTLTFQTIDNYDDQRDFLETTDLILHAFFEQLNEHLRLDHDLSRNYGRKGMDLDEVVKEGLKDIKDTVKKKLEVRLLTL